MARTFVALAIGVGLMLSPAASAKQLARAPLLVSTTGRITALTMSRITVNRVTCALTNKTVARASTFAVGVNVAIQCAGKSLQTIKLAPVTSGHARPPITITGPAPTAPTAPKSSAPSPVTSSVSVRGAITAMTSSSVTIGNQTCPFDPSTYGLQIGEIVQMSCQTEANGVWFSSISLPH